MEYFLVASNEDLITVSNNSIDAEIVNLDYNSQLEMGQQYPNTA